MVRRTERFGARTQQRRLRALTAAQPVALTERQRAVLAGLAAGATYGGIADRLGYAHSTIRKEVLAIYRRLGVNDREAAVVEVRNQGLLDR